MKREDVRPGGEYATDLGEHVQIAGEEPGDDGVVPGLPSAGWVVENGDWVMREEFAQRLVRGGSYRSYQTNVALRAVNVDTGERLAVEPRRLTMPWDQHVAESLKAREQREAAEANGQALVMRANKIGASAHVDLRRREVRLSFDDADTLLRMAKV